MATFFVLLLVAAVAALVVAGVRGRRRNAELERTRAAELARVVSTAEEDVTRFGEELQALDAGTAGAPLDEVGRQDYQRALDSYETAKELVGRVRKPEDVTGVTEALEDGRYAAACVTARVEGRPLPARRPPCFFDPRHGPSTEDVSWTPAGGQERQVPVCAADAIRIKEGAEPAARKVPVGDGTERANYWEAGPAWAPFTRGYYGGYAGSGLLPGLLMGAMIAGPLTPPIGWDGGADGSGDGGSDGGDSGDQGGDAGAQDAGFDGGDSGGDGGGWFDGGFFGGDGGGFDGGGFDGGF